MNSSIMMGRLVRDPQVNYIRNRDGDEVAVANFRIAVDRNFSEETDFFPCAAFGWLAEFTEKYLVQGIKIVVRGSMENDNYTNKDGERVYGVCLKLDSIEFAESKKSQENDDGGRGERSSGRRNRTSGNRGSSRSSRGNSGRSGRSSGSSSGRGNYRGNGSGNGRTSGRHDVKPFHLTSHQYREVA